MLTIIHSKKIYLLLKSLFSWGPQKAPVKRPKKKSIRDRSSTSTISFLSKKEALPRELESSEQFSVIRRYVSLIRNKHSHEAPDCAHSRQETLSDHINRDFRTEAKKGESNQSTTRYHCKSNSTKPVP